MTVPFLDLSRQVEMLREEIDDAIAAVLDDGRFVLGDRVEQFEHDFAVYCGVKHGVGVASGTDAIAIALRALDIGPGDEVITAANTCVPTVAAIEAAGAVPVLADVDPRTLTIDPSSVESALTARTRAVVPVHLYGRCADMDAIATIASSHGLVIVEDAAHAHGASYDGRRAGALGDAAAFSFYPTKNLGALGDGGAIVTNDASVAERARQLRAYGERERYLSVEPGVNSRLDALQAAVLSAKLPLLDGWNDRRRAVAAAYQELFAGLPIVLPSAAEDSDHVFHLYVIRSTSRDVLAETLSSAGVGTAVHYPRAIHHHDAYRRLDRGGSSLAVAEQASAEVLSLPLYPELSDEETQSVGEAVVSALAVH